MNGNEQPTGLHTAVSNRMPEAGAPVEQPLTESPSYGVDPRTTRHRDGKEVVSGYQASRARPERARTLSASTTLRDIAEASFGPAPLLPETVHEVDDRVRITDTAVYPWRVHASLVITAADGSAWIGTGWFIGPNTLATAGHVVYITNSGVPGRDGWVRSIEVMPGRDGDTLPYGSVTSSDFRTVTGWTESGDENFDYGAIILPTALGDEVGWFGFGAYPDADLLAAIGNISGYPGDKPAGTQWYDQRQIAAVSAQKVRYDIDTMGGQSGSAAYRIIDGQHVAVAIHAYGGATTNSGTRINSQVHANLVAWKAEGPT